MIAGSEEQYTREFDQTVVQSGDGFHIQVVGRLIQNQYIGCFDHHAGEEYTYFFTTGADFLEQKLEAINGEVSALKGKIDEISSNWEGSSQSSFIETFEGDMYPILKDTLPEVITGIAAQLDGAADAIEQADEEVAKAFRG